MGRREEGTFLDFLKLSLLRRVYFSDHEFASTCWVSLPLEINLAQDSPLPGSLPELARDFFGCANCWVSLGHLST